MGPTLRCGRGCGKPSPHLHIRPSNVSPLREKRRQRGRRESEVDSANASGTQALTLRGLSKPRSVAREMILEYKKKNPQKKNQREGCVLT